MSFNGGQTKEVAAEQSLGPSSAEQVLEGSAHVFRHF